MKGALITIGTTAARLSDLLRGINPVAGASSSKTYGSQANLQCRAIQLKVDTGTVYVGTEPDVSSTNYSKKLLAGESSYVSDSHVSSLDAGNYWIVGGAAAQKISVEITDY